MKIIVLLIATDNAIDIFVKEGLGLLGCSPKWSVIMRSGESLSGWLFLTLYVQ